MVCQWWVTNYWCSLEQVLYTNCASSRVLFLIGTHYILATVWHQIMKKIIAPCFFDLNTTIYASWQKHIQKREQESSTISAPASPIITHLLSDSSTIALVLPPVVVFMFTGAPVIIALWTHQETYIFIIVILLDCSFLIKNWCILMCFHNACICYT